ncbi:MAG: orotidine-5'-phosphate decarboxylase [Candidatus Thermoplasmatota archaeon]
MFLDKLDSVTKKNNSLLCIGLDIDKKEMPSFLFESCKDPYLEFNHSIIDVTSDLVCAYKLNMAFYEVLGKKGLTLLEKTIKHIPSNIIIILDGKRNDIGNTARLYAESLFKNLSADAVTVNPLLGYDSIQPFLDYHDKCTFILCRTSNQSAREIQDLNVSGVPLYQVIAGRIREWNKNHNCGAVVGATYPDEMKIIRGILGDDAPILIPGVGKQGGDLEKAVRYGVNKDGMRALINSSRGVIYASRAHDYADAARKAALDLRDEINKYLKKH